ncbi:hypothetical protein WR25_01052 isoform E [Diploscapter pachys]|uniref:DUF19 domain-containing protein n=2 Tax=Diploscapter pachys TaxID=2018661 RepID=A0A2A2JSU1_9BILA|nr:hypothetical protein WR25_01052 isoform A [Diploscapter pachys]PAV64825.1 hypothetical protein WR25_01052 isoform B [Diploscapter pachys]PAV64826.1 hypothetical protein WR25_01052 isoform C [Diploscapter pachys]PAV64828.1 hypothetical protein WR25_01052 isoform E [Diploscapter pachys]
MGAKFYSALVLVCCICESLQFGKSLIVLPDAPTCDTNSYQTTKNCFQAYMNNFNISTPYVFGNNTTPGSFNQAIMNLLIQQGIDGWNQMCSWQFTLTNCLNAANVSFDACITQNSYKDWFGSADDDSVEFRTNYYITNYQCGPAYRTVINNWQCLLNDSMRDQDAIMNCYNVLNGDIQSGTEFCLAFDNSTRCLESIITRDCGRDTRGYICMVEEIALMVNTNVCTGRLRDCVEDAMPECNTRSYNETKQCFKAFYDHFGISTPYVFGNSSTPGSYMYARSQLFNSTGEAALNQTCGWQSELNECLRRHDINLDFCANPGSWMDWFLATFPDSSNFRTDFYIHNYNCGPAREQVRVNFQCLYNSTIKDSQQIQDCYRFLNNTNNANLCPEYDRTIRCLEEVYVRECGPGVRGYICNIEELGMSVNTAQCAGNMPDCSLFAVPIYAECRPEMYNNAKMCFDTFYKSFGLTAPYIFGNNTTPNSYSKAEMDMLMSQGRSGWDQICQRQFTLTNCLNSYYINYDNCINPYSMREWFGSPYDDSFNFRTSYYIQEYQCGPANRVVQDNYNCLMNYTMKQQQEYIDCYAQLNDTRDASQFCHAFNNGTRCLERILTRDCGWDVRGYTCTIENMALQLNTDACTGRLRDCSEDSTAICLPEHYRAAKECFAAFYRNFNMNQAPFVFGNGSVPGSYMWERRQIYQNYGQAALNMTCGWQQTLNQCLRRINMSMDVCIRPDTWMDWFLSTWDDSYNFRTNYYVENYNCGPAIQTVRANWNCIRNSTFLDRDNVTSCYRFINNTDNDGEFCRGYDRTIECLERIYDKSCGIGVRGYICNVEELALTVNTAACGGQLPDCTRFSVPVYADCPADMYNAAKVCFNNYYTNFNIQQPYQFGNLSATGTFVNSLVNLFNTGVDGFNKQCGWQNALTSCLNNANVNFDNCIVPISWFEWFGTPFDDAWRFRETYYRFNYECGPAKSLAQDNFLCLHNLTNLDQANITNCYSNINDTTSSAFCSSYDQAITCMENVYTQTCGSQVGGFICNTQQIILSVDTNVCVGRLQDCTALGSNSATTNPTIMSTTSDTSPITYLLSMIFTLIVSLRVF